MVLKQVFGALLLFIVCPLLGGLPIIDWSTRLLTGKRLRQLGTGNVSVSAAFFHGGKPAGIVAALSEAAKGAIAVLLARSFFPNDPVWELIALIALIMGRYWVGAGAGTTNLIWGYTVHDPISAGFVFLIGGIGFTILREPQLGRFSVLVLFPLMTALRHSSDRPLILAAIALAALMAWIYQKIPDDLTLDSQAAQAGSRKVFKFFRGDRGIATLNQALTGAKVGQKAARLSELRQLGYPVPEGWVLLPGDDPTPLIEQLEPSPAHPFVVRSSALDEDAEGGSAAGIYDSFLDLTNRDALRSAINRCFESYDNPRAIAYRRDRQLREQAMAVLIQPQIRSVFSGVAFSRDPITRQGEAVLVEALPGSASRVVSGQVTPERYRLWIREGSVTATSDWRLPADLKLPMEGSEGDVPAALIQQVAYLARQIEQQYRGVPQDIEWSYDGQQLWLLQARPITTLLPIWTRKIAAEVIPGFIQPLTWSINRPLTCGVWGDLFTIVLGEQSQGLDFKATATLHHSVAYFNASLLGEIFLRMGLPPDSLEFLTRGAKFSKPPLLSTARNVPGLLRLVQREFALEKDFARDDRRQFTPFLAELAQKPADSLSAIALGQRIDMILSQLNKATYYSILAPLSAALRTAIFKVPERAIDASATPEVAVVRSLQNLAQQAKAHLPSAFEQETLTPDLVHRLFKELQQTTGGQSIVQQFDQILQQYGYLSEVGTDIAVPTWREEPMPVQTLFVQFCIQAIAEPPAATSSPAPRKVQSRFTLKGRVTEVYSRLLAELRWSFLALERQWLDRGWLRQPGDIFLLEYDEVRQLIESDASDVNPFEERIEQRRQQLERDRQAQTIPYLVYGNAPPMLKTTISRAAVQQKIQGIAASPGLIEGEVKVARSLTDAAHVNAQTILVVPYTDSGWAAILARVGGLISEVGGQLSHGAIVAREYQIPAVMDIPNATQLFHDGQRVRLDGETGVIEVLAAE
ncbi:MAG TPA: glycerol-3-phosphate acyltransferase [Leptolyngbyaceae cyanobacterium M33_DOE_097]|uniref:Pyruvate phosphate dikinase PEP/pyruvate-binding protein n=1 Tax=Oscillatoriales cyanobacterium SpSt-418 TaxID=2282169 RepID=A0A7C3KE73_9CYAN|nr:glycerol-3-phosphate acyltransferase [Leptolyngbyaceae cyanobacterium M33_DOE_097]